MMNRLPRDFRKLSIEERRSRAAKVFQLEEREFSASKGSGEMQDLADIMIESAIGIMPVPLGLATGFRINGSLYDVPLATEEPSVVAAATYAARIIGEDGFQTWATDPIMQAQVFLEQTSPDAEQKIASAEEELRSLLRGKLASLEQRGGGYRGLSTTRLAGSGLLQVDLSIDVRDAMGANLLNTAAEAAQPHLERVSGGRTLMSILSNQAAQRRAGARFLLSSERLSPAARGMDPPEVMRRIVLASDLAQESPERAVTHNKGIMNGISALALATGNDTRAVEAAAHAWSSRGGQVRGLSRYSLQGQCLEGWLELPLALATIGGAVGTHPVSRTALKILGQPNSAELAQIAAAVGLAQNFAALLALVSGGLQRGHMKLHAARLAFQAGARGAEVRAVADRMAESQSYHADDAAAALAALRGKNE
jgi:hydroxymethylglutaryl-CoA reductase